MTNSAQSSDRAPGARVRSGLAWFIAGSLFSACSMLAPDDQHFLSDASSSAGGQGDSIGGHTGVGGFGALGGAAGASDAGAAGEAGNSSGGDGPTTCSEGIADCNDDANDGCETDLSSSSDNCGGCGKDFACATDEVCERGECVSSSGCSDGTREGFLPLGTWPRLAGCTARWPRGSLREPKSGGPCGFELAVCEVPADACGVGWHVCAAPPYGPAEVSAQVTAEECSLEPGAFAIAVGDVFCEPCIEGGNGAACCGAGCVQQNGHCIFPGMTAWFGVINGYVNACGAIESDQPTRGVLCCRDA